jgi:hypothetical protein
VLDLQIDRLSLTLAGAAGHEHRVEPIAARAVALLGERLDRLLAEGAARPAAGAAGALEAPPVNLDLAASTDEDAAGLLADALLAALAPQLDIKV